MLQCMGPLKFRWTAAFTLKGHQLRIEIMDYLSQNHEIIVAVVRVLIVFMKADMSKQVGLAHLLEVIQDMAEIGRIHTCQRKSGNLRLRIHPLYSLACAHKQGSVSGWIILVDLLIGFIPYFPFMYSVLIAGHSSLHILFPCLQCRLISEYLCSQSHFRRIYRIAVPKTYPWLDILTDNAIDYLVEPLIVISAFPCLRTGPSALDPRMTDSELGDIGAAFRVFCITSVNTFISH